MTIKQALSWANKNLKNSDSPILDSEVLLGFVINKDKSYLYTYPEKKLTKAQEKKHQILIKKRKANWPVAYLINKKEFFGFDFFVDQRVLIPRPESEIIVLEAIKLIKRHQLKNIADIGTGSGALAIAIKKTIPRITVNAVDLSSRALQVAKKNAKKLNAKINFFHGNLLSPIKNKRLDLLIANLPYLSYNVYRKGKEIKKEPKMALVAKKQGKELIYKLLDQIYNLKKIPKFTILEHDPQQTTALLKYIKQKKHQNISLIKDLHSNNRLILIMN